MERAAQTAQLWATGNRNHFRSQSTFQRCAFCRKFRSRVYGLGTVTTRTKRPSDGLFQDNLESQCQKGNIILTLEPPENIRLCYVDVMHVSTVNNAITHCHSPEGSNAAKRSMLSSSLYCNDSSDLMQPIYLF